MGDEIPHRFFAARDFSRFRERLDAETALLRKQLAANELSHHSDMAGFELEAWLVDADGFPLPDNQHFLNELKSSLVVPELAKFNIELNSSPVKLTGHAFSRMYNELQATWNACTDAAAAVNGKVVAIGTLPTAQTGLFSSDNMSELRRYQSLNDRVLALRDGRDLRISIDGVESLDMVHDDVMLEAAATSLQIHLQGKPERFVRDYNASILASAPVVAVSANAPLLFGHNLWDESRIPLFEQSVDLGNRYPARVGIGSGYLKDSVMELFDDNQRNHPVLIPLVQDTPANRFGHLRFHNGTVWRWNRPLVGFDAEGLPNLRIEHRVPSAGPTVRDCIANAAFYFGLVYGMGLAKVAPEEQLPFLDARENFYNAARYGLNAHAVWHIGEQRREGPIRTLILEELLPLARRGLQQLELPAQEIEDYLGIISARVESTQNGAAWQRRWLALNQGSLADLTLRYCELQATGEPVHTWPL